MKLHQARASAPCRKLRPSRHEEKARAAMRFLQRIKSEPCCALSGGGALCVKTAPARSVEWAGPRSSRRRQPGFLRCRSGPAHATPPPAPRPIPRPRSVGASLLAIAELHALPNRRQAGSYNPGPQGNAGTNVDLGTNRRSGLARDMDPARGTEIAGKPAPITPAPKEIRRQECGLYES